ncbi:MAG TPA: ArsR family transcriptional regulator [Methanosarcinaceae archaeon]|nr:ArsR family transcriptional regulator [Methanosarcinaceae archaeon]
MEPTQVLDILGNKNRRKILQLLSNRPCYVSEISGRLGVGPKAIISHLGLLEETGLIECRVDEQRRKYFNIVDNMRLEVSLSPHSYAVSVHTSPVNTEYHLKQDHNATVEVQKVHAASVLAELNLEIRKTKNKQEELTRKQQELQVVFTELMDICMDAVIKIADTPLQVEILYALLKKEHSIASLSYIFTTHPSLISVQVLDMAKKGFIEYTIRDNQQYWKILETKSDTGNEQ